MKLVGKALLQSVPENIMAEASNMVAWIVSCELDHGRHPVTRSIAPDFYIVQPGAPTSGFQQGYPYPMLPASFPVQQNGFHGWLSKPYRPALNYAAAARPS